MTTETDGPGAGAGAGTGAGTGAGGAPAAGAVVADLLGGGASASASAGAGAGANAGAAAGGEGAGGAAWWESEAFKLSGDKGDPDSLSDAEWLANKKYGGFADVIKAQRSLEAKLGQGKLVPPKGPDDLAAHEEIYKALGRPDDPKGYDIPLPDGDDGSFADAFRPVAHKIGLSAGQVKDLAGWFNGLADEAQTLNADKARGELTTEWGDGFKANIEFAKRAQQSFGLDDVAVEKIASGYGLANTLKLFAKLGQSTGEAGGLPGGKGGGFAKSLEQMQARKAEIIKSPELSKKLTDGDPATMAEWKAIAAAETAELDRLNAS